MSNSTAGAIAPLSIKFNVLTLAAATTAAIAASTSASLGWSVWAMFVGWVAYFTRGHSAKDAFYSYLCLVIGIAFGTAAAMAVGALLPLMGPLAFAPIVFVVAMVVVSLRAAAPLNNIPAYFLGLITFFAAHRPPSLVAFGELAAVSAIGTLAAWLAHRWQTRILRS